jgi:site-specific DNA-cytosine methylase
MRFGSLFSGAGGMDLGIEQSGMECVWQVENMPFALKILTRHWPKVPKHTDVLTFCVEDGHVRTIQSQVTAKAMQEKKVASLRSFAECCEYLIHAGLLQRMFQGYYPSMPEKTFAKCSPSCKTSGMAYRGEYLIVDTSESPNNAVVSSLSDILEDHVHPRYYLSKNAINGIIRRSKKWGRSGYVFLQEMVNGKTLVQKTLSLSVLELIFGEHQEISKNPSSQTQLPKKKHNNTQEPQLEKEILLRQQLEHKKLETEYKDILLRRLTPTEKERLQGFPPNWTVPEGLSLVMQLR